MYTAPHQCPTCASALETRELACPVCATTVRGRWTPDASPFGHLTAEQQTFLLLFVRSRGNLSDVERTLGVSYPTIRAKLDDLIAALDAPAAPAPAAAPPSPRRQAILEQVARGALSADEALARLRQLPRTEDQS
jgi:hypothetical protein